VSLLDAPAIRAATMAEVGTLLRSLKLPPGTALAATGSFARGEMTPYSDIDLLLIHPDGTQHPQADGVWYPIWDAKKRLDYAVRTPRECEEMVATDTTAALALLELRPIAGDAQLVEEAIQRVRTRWRRSVPKTFNTVVDTAIARWNRSGSVVAMTRPDVKHGRGGLRDIELLKALALGNVCDAPPLEEQHRLLLDIRTLLHVETRRSRDVLDPECATDIATHLGFDDRLDLSRALADAARTIDATLTQALTTARHVLRRPRNYRRRPVDLGVVDAGDELRLSRNQSLDDPGLVLRVGAASARTGLPVSAATWRRLASTPPLPTPWPATATGDFFALLGSSEHTARVVGDMDTHGLWERIVPEWVHIRGLMPREPSHINTIDVHCLNTVANCAHVSVNVSRPDLLLLAALFHDIGKGYNRPHSQVGAEMITRMAARMGLNPRDRMCVQTLVAEHTLLARLAATHDPWDDAAVDTLLDALHYDLLTVELLQELTEADARATGPAVWTAHLNHAVTTLANCARNALTAVHPHKPHVSTPTDLGLTSSGELAHVHWRGNDIIPILALIAAKGWNIVTARIVAERTMVRAEFDVRAMHVGGFNQEEFIQGYKSGVFSTLPTLEPAATATHWFGSVLEVRTVDRRGALGALLNVIPDYTWCTVELPGSTMIARFHLCGAFDRAAVERSITRVLATG